MEKKKVITAQESKKIGIMMKRVIQETNKIIKKKPHYSAFRVC